MSLHTVSAAVNTAARRLSSMRCSGTRPLGLRRLGRALLLLLVMAWAARFNPAQQQTTKASSGAAVIMQQMDGQDSTFRGRGFADNPEPAAQRLHRYKAMNAIRQRAMVDDSNKLFQLTTQLKAEVAGNSAQALNSDQLRQVAEIEKLAKSIREKMSDAIGPTPPIMRPPSVMGPSMQVSY